MNENWIIFDRVVSHVLSSEFHWTFKFDIR